MSINIRSSYNTAALWSLHCSSLVVGVAYILRYPCKVVGPTI